MDKADDISMEGHGVVRGGGIVLDQPLGLPEGTEVRLRIAVVASAAPTSESPHETEAPEHKLTNEQLLEWARKHPAPQEWWDATDNPFEP